MSEELTKIDGTLDDRLFAPFRQAFYNQAGGPTVLVSTCLRMMAKAHHSQSSRFACGLLTDFKVDLDELSILEFRDYGTRLLIFNDTSYQC